ncbi:hypothetical protein A0H81_07292 [Grifola frondosa]|uniref:Secreted protein n=1 Tax=Grifola frondosa TaxID=5627 RepID=A0A1C7M9E4_GRIFR|nr:hypothetical protein A0H81_07292 [Grifola frondosa]
MSFLFGICLFIILAYRALEICLAIDESTADSHRFTQTNSSAMYSSRTCSSDDDDDDEDSAELYFPPIPSPLILTGERTKRSTWNGPWPFGGLRSVSCNKMIEPRGSVAQMRREDG